MEKKTTKTKDGLNLYYETYNLDGQKPPIFFLHGMGGDLDAWQYVRDDLLKGGYSAIAMDLRGHGYSDHPRNFESYKVSHLAEDVLTIINNENIRKIILVGHCYGAVVAEHFAIKYQDKLEKLILISGTYRSLNYITGNFLRTLANGIANFGAFISPKPYRSQHSDYPRGKFHKDYEWFGLARTIFHNSLRSYLLASREIINLELELVLANIKIPTLVAVGDQDSIFPVAISKRIHESIPNSKFEVIKGANHVVILNNPKEILLVIKNFLVQ